MRNRIASRAGVRVSGGDLCEAEALTEAAAETTALPIITPSACENDLFQRFRTVPGLFRLAEQRKEYESERRYRDGLGQHFQAPDLGLRYTGYEKRSIRGMMR